MREYWSAVRDADFVVPGDRGLADLIEDLLSGLASPDPQLRDETVLPVLATWIGRGDCDGHAVSIGDRAVAMLRHEEIQARTFAVLVLAALIERDNDQSIVEEVDAHRWFAEFARWWTGETDLRGHDAHLGWLHAIAHGADALGAYGRSRHLTAIGLRELLSVAAHRITAETDQLWGAGEDDRLALACSTILARQELADSDVTSWLDDIAEDLTDGVGAVPMPAWKQNTLHTLKALYVHADRGAELDGERIVVPRRRCCATKSPRYCASTGQCCRCKQSPRCGIRLLLPDASAKVDQPRGMRLPPMRRKRMSARDGETKPIPAARITGESYARVVRRDRRRYKPSTPTDPNTAIKGESITEMAIR